VNADGQPPKAVAPDDLRTAAVDGWGAVAGVAAVAARNAAQTTRTDRLRGQRHDEEPAGRQQPSPAQPLGKKGRGAAPAAAEG
jgi:hypothetical protein